MGEPARHPRGMLPPGTRIGRYELVRRLAKGGMAELYLARAHGIHGFEKLVVLKLVLPYLAEDREFVDMFLHEARLAATLDHPNIVHVTDIGEVDGEPFFVMEYVHGQDVRAIMRAATRAGKTLPLPCALSIATGVATGLHYVHEQRGPDGRFLGLVHRDVSPANVVVSYGGGVKLVDFGIAKATELRQSTRSGVLKGKVNYMAPEQCHGVAVDRRTDVFALGILLYETTTGRRLFAGDSDFYVMSRIVRGLFARPSEIDPEYPTELEAIVLRALATDPEDRHATAQQLLADIEGFAHEQRLRLSGMGVTDFMRELFGEQPHPGTEDADELLPTMVHPDALGSGPRGSAPEVVRPTAVSAVPETATTVLPQASAGAIEISDPPTAIRHGEHVTTRVIDGKDEDADLVTVPTRALAKSEISPALATEPTPRFTPRVITPNTNEPTPRVVANIATEPTPRLPALLATPRPPVRRNRHIGLAIGLGLAAVVAFAIGVSAGTWQREAPPTSADDDATTPASVRPPSTPASSVPQRTSEAASRKEAEANVGEELSRPTADDPAPAEPELAPVEAAPAPKTPRPAKKKRPRTKTPEEKPRSGLDAMYPSTSRPGPVQARDRE